jgi:dihydroorotate dehydrogenase
VIDLYPAVRSLLFSLPPEAAHAITLGGLRVANRLGLLTADSTTRSEPVSLMGLTFPNRLGIAAGLDKNATYIDELGALGVGFVEVGTVTPRPQSGNPRPRLFRLAADRALINRMGFPNEGVEAMCERLRRRRFRGICGVNIGKNADTPLTNAASDYVACFAAVQSVADYVAVNISSPNTAELRRLQQGDLLKSLLDTLLTARELIGGRYVPILVKLTADLDDRELIDAANIACACGIDGLIATNTIVNRDGVRHARGVEAGGLSGVPLFGRALHAVRCLRAEVGPNFPIAGVGGIDSASAAIAMRAAGADLLQVYTGLIYRGPALVSEIVKSAANA